MNLAFQRHHPEVAIAGFPYNDHTVIFYLLVNSLLRPDATVLDFGAGRGRSIFQESSDFRRQLLTLRGKVARVVGVDPDPVVSTNPSLDEAHVIDAADLHLPLADASVDLVLSDWTFEHIAEPVAVVAELSRVLKPGGWLCARTPNRWGYIGLGNQLVPEALKSTVLRYLQPSRKAEDVFPTLYQMNDRRTLHRLLPSPGWRDHTFALASSRAYAGDSSLLYEAFRMLAAVTPPSMQPVLCVFMQKAESENGNAS